MFARVLLDIKSKNVNRLFDYIIPTNMELEKGMRVIVPFGEQKRLGFVIDIIEQSDIANKEILEVLDIVPTISNELFLYLKYLSETNLTLYINIVETIIPSELFINYEQRLILKDINLVNDNIKHLFNNKNEITVTKALDEFKYAIKKSIENKGIELVRDYKKKAKPKTVFTYEYNDIVHNYKRINNYLELIEFIRINPNLTKKELVENNFSGSALDTLTKHNVLIKNETVVERLVVHKETEKVSKHKLNKEQEIAFNKIKNSLDEYITFLLFGITGSGKTEVYMHLINEVLKKGKKVLYLVPEITLVAPTVNYLKSRFNEVITHYNSSLSKGERHDAWYKIVENEANIIVGTRSSAFLPINDLGIIIVDEEHDNSYNQVDRVQYNLIDIINIKAKYHNIPILLGSATPKVSSMYYAKKGKYKLLKLTKRATNEPLPKINYVDMKDELINGNTDIFSKVLKTKIKDRLNKKEQVILLYNRKGYSSFVMCRICGHVPKCKNCDVSLTYYKDENELRCSYCNYKEDYQKICQTCGSSKIGEVGLGVEQVFNKVKNAFKDAKVLLMDANTTRKKGSHEQLWLDFKEEKYDILVGTQMVSKGLNFPKVTLVGILMADLELKVPHYLAPEQTYNLLTQMVGRSGRASYGEAVIQGYDLDHYAISSVNKKYENFYKEALYLREISKYEPFYEMVQILVTNESYLKAYQDALMIKKTLNEYIVLGPMEPLIKYIKNEYRFVITIKGKNIDYLEMFNVIKKYSETSKVYFIKNPQII